MAAAGVPTARARVCSTPDEAAAALDEFGSPYVVKDDGLAAGKGVVVTDRPGRGAGPRGCLRAGRRRGVPRRAGGVAVRAHRRRRRCVPLAPAQDFKRVGDGDAGPEHRRHGRLLAAAVGPAGLVDQVLADVLQPTVDEMAPARHAVRRPAVRRAGADVARGAGDRVQRAVRRPGDPGRAGPAAHAAGRPAARRCHRDAARRRRRWTGRTTRRSPSWSPRTATRRRRAPATRSRGLDAAGRGRGRGGAARRHRADASGRVVSAAAGCCPWSAPAPTWRPPARRRTPAVDRIDLPGSHHRTDIAAAAAACRHPLTSGAFAQIPGPKNLSERATRRGRGESAA